MNTISLSRALPLALVAFVTLTGGCIQYEELDQRIVLEEDDIVRVTLAYHNFQEGKSILGESTSDEFGALIGLWKEDGFLVQVATDRMHVVSRKLWVEKGQLNGVLQMLASSGDLTGKWADSGIDSTGYYEWRGIGNYGYDDFGIDSVGFWQRIDPTEFEIVSTNGAVSLSDSQVTVRWLPSARELLIHTKQRNFSATTSFADSFRAYLRAEKKTR